MKDGVFDHPSPAKIAKPAECIDDLSEMESRLNAFFKSETVCSVVLPTYLKTLSIYEETIKYKKSLATSVKKLRPIKREASEKSALRILKQSNLRSL